MNLALFYIWEDVRVWAQWNHSFDMHLSYLKNWCFRTVLLETTLESSLDSKEIKPVNPKGNQPWILIRRADAEAEVPILWPPDPKSQFTGKDSDARKDWGKDEKGATENEMVGWHHQLNGHEFDQTLGDSEGQASLACYSPWGRKESDTTESNWTTFWDGILFFSILNPLRGWLQCLMSCWLQYKVCDILHPLNQSTWSINTQESFKIKACSKEALENDLNRTNTCVFSHVWLFVTRRLLSAMLLCPWDFPGKNAGVRCHFLLQGIFPTQRLNQHSCIAGRFFTTGATWEAPT